MRASVLLALAVSLLPAQSIDSSGLISGYLYDEPSHSLRPIAGVPGSAYLGRAVLSGLDQALAAPGSGWALALRGGQTVLAQLNNGSVSREWTPDGMLASYTMAAWSGDGKSAVLYDALSKKLQRISVEDGSASIVATLPLEIEAVRTVTANRAGSRVAITAGQEGAMQLYSVSGDQVQKLLDSALFGPVAAVGEKFYVADEAAAMMIEAGDAVAPAWPLPEAMSALHGAADGKRLYAAARASARIVVFDIASRTVAGEIATDLPAASLLTLSRETLVLLNARRQKGDTLFVLDTESGPAVYFVPAGDE